MRPADGAGTALVPAALLVLASAAIHAAMVPEHLSRHPRRAACSSP